MEIKIENQFCVKRFKPGHSRVARCHKPISILCQERFKPGHSRVARCHKSIFILCQARFKPGHSRVARCHKPIFILCQVVHLYVLAAMVVSAMPYDAIIALWSFAVTE